MANYIVSDADLISIADAIRSRGGTASLLTFPQGFVDAIDAIETGEPTLPEEYKSVEYIQSDGQAYLDTGVIIADALNSYVYLKYELVKSFKHIGIFGNIKGDMKFEIRYGGRAYICFGPTNVIYPSDLDAVAGTLNAIHILTKNENGKIQIDNTVNNGTNQNVHKTPLSNIYLFSIRDTNGIANEIADGLRVYSFKLYEGTRTVWNGVPCVRISDDEPGMYDFISKSFFTNAGNGAFVIPNS